MNLCLLGVWSDVCSWLLTSARAPALKGVPNSCAVWRTSAATSCGFWRNRVICCVVLCVTCRWNPPSENACQKSCQRRSYNLLRIWRQYSDEALLIRYHQSWSVGYSSKTVPALGNQIACSSELMNTCALHFWRPYGATNLCKCRPQLDRDRQEARQEASLQLPVNV